MKLQVEVVAKTDVGLKRKNNEDNFGLDTRIGLFILCDGMGGQAAGEIASRLAVQCVLDYFRESQRMQRHPIAEADPGLSNHANAMLSAMRLANRAIYDAGSHNAKQSGMGSTIVAAKLNGGMLTVGNVGDSRAYLFRGGKLKQLTNDHSLVMEQLRRGFITEDEASRSAFQNIITRALGSSETVEPEAQEWPINSGDVLLLTCDGITKVVSDQQISSLLSGESNIEIAAARLIEAAKENNSDDNLTCILVRLLRRGWFSKRYPHKVMGPFS